jgi:hypothetical protein
VGASAGGLDALQRLIAAIPVDTGFAVVVLQHLPPSQTGVLAKLLTSDRDAGDRHRSESSDRRTRSHALSLVRGAGAGRCAEAEDRRATTQADRRSRAREGTGAGGQVVLSGFRRRTEGCAIRAAVGSPSRMIDGARFDGIHAIAAVSSRCPGTEAMAKLG